MVTAFMARSITDLTVESNGCRKQRRSLKPQLAAAHLPDTSSQTVPLARTMSEKITAQRDWAMGRARNASLARST
jgi:hypothetical protein